MKAILHADNVWGIGKDNALMFKIPADMKFFRETTTGNVVVMGVNTLKSLPEEKPLKNRINIVLDSEGIKREGCVVVSTVEQLFSELKKYDENKIFVIGGASTYSTLLSYCSEVLVTKVDANGGADVFFKNLDKDETFKLIYESEPLETNGYMIKFTTYKNLAVKQF